MRIAILGAGAIGCLFGIRLHESGQNVLLVNHNPRTVATIRRRGVALTEISGKSIKSRLKASRTLDDNYHPDLVLVTVKAYDTGSVARQLRKKIDEGTLILSLQNGLGNIETLCRYLPRGSVLAGTTTEGALTTGPGTVAHTGKGSTYIGEFSGKLTKRVGMIRDVFRNAGFRTHATKRVESVIWSKAIVNSAINPISVLARVSNKEILRNSDLKDAALRLVREGVVVAKAHGVSPSPSPSSMLIEILTSARRNRSSMLRDIEAGRKTEIRQLNRAIAWLGRRLRVSVPYNTLLSELVLGVEASNAAS